MTGRVPIRTAVLACGIVLATLAPAPAAAQAEPGRSQAQRISVTWTRAPIRDVLQAFAAFSGTSIVAGSNVDGFVTADINDEPWDVALRTILTINGLIAVEDEYGIITVQNIADVNAREDVEPLLTRAYRISFSRAQELQGTIAPLLSARGSVSVVATNNTLVVTDIARVQRAISALLR